jgi:hypothetical protein
VSGAFINGISGSGATRTVSVNTGIGSGTIRLNVNASGTSIEDLAGNPLSGGFTTGEAYTIQKTYLIYLPWVLKQYPEPTPQPMIVAAKK